MNLPRLIRDLSEAAGIPQELVPSVVHRAQMAVRAIEIMKEWKSGRYRPGPGARVLARRVVEDAVRDLAAGVLERICE